jgi:hypothetical protein
MVDSRHFAKILLTQGLDCGQTRQDYEEDIAKRAESIRNPGESDAQVFTRYVTETEDGRLLFKAAIAAKPRQAPQDFVATEKPAAGPAASEMNRVVDEFMSKNPKLSRSQAYDRVFTDNRELAARVKAEEHATKQVAAQREPIRAAEREFSR